MIFFSLGKENTFKRECYLKSNKSKASVSSRRPCFTVKLCRGCGCTDKQLIVAALLHLHTYTQKKANKTKLHIPPPLVCLSDEVALDLASPG